MGLSLPLYGMLLGLVCAVYCYFTGQLGLFGAIALYSGTGVVSVISGAILVAMKPDEIEGRQANCPPLPLAINR